MSTTRPNFAANGPAHTRLAAHHATCDSLRERIAALSGLGEFGVDLFAEPSPELRALEEELRQANAAMLAEVEAGRDEREAEWLAGLDARVAATREGT